MLEENYQKIKTEKDLRAYCRRQGLPVYNIKVSRREIVSSFSLMPENASAKDGQEREEKNSSFTESLDVVLIRELEPGLRNLSAFVCYKSSWGDTWARIEQGEKIEEFNLIQGKIYRYWNRNPKIGERRVEFSFDENQHFPYAFADTSEPNGKQRLSISELPVK